MRGHLRNVVIYKQDVISYTVGKLEDRFRYYSLARQTDKKAEAQTGAVAAPGPRARW